MSEQDEAPRHVIATAGLAAASAVTGPQQQQEQPEGGDGQ